MKCSAEVEVDKFGGKSENNNDGRTGGKERKSSKSRSVYCVYDSRAYNDDIRCIHWVDKRAFCGD